MKEDLFFLGIKGLIRNAEGEILLIQVNPAQLRAHASWSGNAYWDIPGGRIKRGDDIQTTLGREISEEIGVKDVSEIKHLATIISKQRVPREETDYGLILSVYTCSIPPDSAITLSEENLSFGWFSPIESAIRLKDKYPPEFTDFVAKL